LNRISRQPFFWMGLHTAALWPQWAWYWKRLTDGSDDPLGIIALLALVIMVTRLARQLRSEPAMGWLFVAGALSMASALALQVTPLLGALIGVLSLAAGLAAWLPAGTARVPYAGMLILSLPLISSLQFYAGYPLRVVTAQLSCWVLSSVGFVAERSGSSILVSGQLVIVDAPCSGIQMAWMAYFAAFAAAAVRAIPDRVLLRRLPLVGLLVLAGNILRNTVLVAREASGTAPSELTHEAVGLVALAAVCGLVLLAVSKGVQRVPVTR
jgi:exosortase/archaeosortase family protein